MKPVVYHPEARAEFAAVAERYESLAAGLGNSFIDEVEAIVARIEESPAQFPVWQGNPRFQKAVLPETFPFVVFFRELDDCIRIERVARDASEDTPKPVLAATSPSLLGLMADEPDVVDEMCALVYQARSTARLRTADD